VPQWHVDERLPVTVAGAAAELLRVPKTKRVEANLGRNASSGQSRHGNAATLAMLPAMVFDSRCPTRIWAAFLLCLAASAASASDDTPGYVSIRRDQAFLREGPSYAHRILWVYRRKNYPLQVIGSYDAWRHVRDSDGTTGWMHHTQLSDRRSVLFIGNTKSPLRQDDDPRSKVIAHAAVGVVALLKACERSVCEVDAAGIDGWVDKRNIWGVDAGEVIP
jgi:SH3-like domain-containing protein